MQALLKISALIDAVLTLIAQIGKWFGLLLILVVCYDVASRYMGVPKPWGLNSTMVQEGEYWIHTYLFATMIGYAYLKQKHVRIDLLREGFSPKTKLVVELIGICLFLIPYVLIAVYYTGAYAHVSFLEGEISKSLIGIPQSWLLKSAITMLFVLMGLAALSQLIKTIAGLANSLSPEILADIIGEGE